jgi:RNA polymerase sigma-70 factor (ECF subfamily)
VRAWRALPSFRGDSRFSTWLHRIVVNTSWTWRARAGRHRAASIDEITTEPVAAGITPERSAENLDLGERLTAALECLPRTTRTVVVLKDLYEWSHREIADELAITVGAAKVRLHRGRRRLRELLWEEPGTAQ